MYKTYQSLWIDQTKRWVNPNITLDPLPSQSHTDQSLFHCYVYNPTQFTVIFFLCILRPWIWFLYWNSLFPSGFLAEDSTEPTMEGQHACSRQWMASQSSQNAPRGGIVHVLNSHKNSSAKGHGGKKNTLFRTDVFFLFFLYHCFYDLVRRCHRRGENALDLNSRDRGFSINCHSLLSFFFFLTQRRTSSRHWFFYLSKESLVLS